MTTTRHPEGCTLTCDTPECGKKVTGLSHDAISAQRAAIAFFGWRVYKDGELWKHACLKCAVEWRNTKLLEDKP